MDSIAKKKIDPRFDQGLIPLQKFISRADEMKGSWGKTDLYSTGCLPLDLYLGGGYGRQKGYEIVLIYGNPGQGKSTLGLNFMIDPIARGVNVGLMILEDDPADVVNRMRAMMGPDIDKVRNVFFVNDQSEGYTLDQALDAIENWFEVCDVVFLDHLEYLWKGSVGQSDKDKWAQQEIWMRKLNLLMKRTQKTIVMVQHTNKSSNAEGMNNIMGSSSLQQTATKVIEYGRAKDGTSSLRLWKTRFTPYRPDPIQIAIQNFKLVAI